MKTPPTPPRLRPPRLLALLTLALIAAPTTASAAIVNGPYLLQPAADAMTVCWTTATEAPGSVTWEPAHGETAGPPRTVVGDSRKVFEDEWRHCARLTGLATGAGYSYVVTDGAQSTEPAVFHTAPAPGEPFRFVVYGDNQREYTGEPNEAHLAVIEAVLQAAPDFVVHLGDMVRTGDNQPSWGQFFKEAAPVLATTPLIPVFGNHERAGDSDGVNYGGYFPAADAADTSLWYAVRYGDLAMFVLDMERINTIRKPDSPQHEWLTEALARVRADPGVRHMMAFHHRPAFSWVPGRNRQKTARTVVAPILKNAGVEMVWSSHDHHYARAEIDGRPHVVTGGGGAGLYAFEPGVADLPEHRAHAMAYHVCVVDVEGDTAFVTARQVPDGAVLDRFEVRAVSRALDDDAPEPLSCGGGCGCGR